MSGSSPLRRARLTGLVSSFFARDSLGRILLRSFLLIVIISLLSVSVITTWQQYSSSRAQVVNHLTSVAILKENQVRSWHRSLSQSLELLVANSRVGADITRLLTGTHNEIMLAGWRNILKETLTVVQASGHQFDEVFLIDSQGQVVVSTNPANEGVSFTDEAFFEQGLYNTSIQPPAPSELYNGHFVIFASTPIYDETGTVRGVLAGASELADLNQIMGERSGLGHTGETYLVTPNFIMLTTPRQDQANSHPLVRTKGALAAFSGQAGFGIYSNYQDPPTRVLGVYRWLPELNVALLAEQNETEAFGPALRNIWLTLSLTLLAALIAAIVTILVTREFTQPLEKLTAAATRMASGDLTRTADIQRQDEIGALANAFNRMTVQLRSLIEGLELRVAMRTAELETQTEALRQSHQQLEATLDALPDLLFELDSQLQICDFRAPRSELFFAQPHEFIGKRVGEMLPPDAVQIITRAIQEAIQHGRHEGAIYSLPMSDGQKWFELSIAAKGDPSAPDAHFVTLVRDITDRKLAQEAEHRQRVLAEALRDTAATLNSTLDLDRILDSILTHVGQVVRHDAASIVLVENEQQVRTVRQVRSALPESTPEVQSHFQPLASIPGLRSMIDAASPVVISDAVADPVKIEDKEHTWARSFVGAPILLKGRVVGFINLYSITTGFFNSMHAEGLQAFANQAAIAFANAWLVDELRQANDQLRSRLAEIQELQAELREQAIRDHLTGLYNRRFLQESLAREVSRAQRAAIPIGIIIMDIDRFKSINDTYGHAAGDLMLQHLGRILISLCRSEDISCRYGGEEFVVVMPGASLDITHERAETIRTRVETTRVDFENSMLHATVSVGVAVYPLHGTDSDILLIHADRALYQAKNDGRNRVVIYLDDVATPSPSAYVTGKTK